RDGRPRKRSARAPTADRELASVVPGHHHLRRSPSPSPSRFVCPPPARAPPILPCPSANWPTLAPPRSPSPSAPGAALLGPRSPRPRPRLPALAFSTAGPGPPPGRPRMGGRVQRFPSSGVAVEPPPPPRGPVTLPHAGRLIASAIDSPALVGPPSCAQTLPCPKTIPGGGLSHRMWATCSGAPISGRQLADVLTAHAPRQGPAPKTPARRRRQLAVGLGARSLPRAAQGPRLATPGLPP